jgi:hypothetical protein
MARPLQIQITEKARLLIADAQHWCRGHLAQDAKGVSVFPTSARAVRRCGLGALIAAAYELTSNYDAAHELAHTALRPHCGISTLVHVNDVRGHAAVLALFDEVIAAQPNVGAQLSEPE